MNKFEFLDQFAAELAANEQYIFAQLTDEAQRQFITIALRSLTALEKLGIIVEPPNKNHICIRCHRELQTLPEPAAIPYIATRDVKICFDCVKHLKMLVDDQERRHPKEKEEDNGNKD